jgi:predicted amidophosphoribosyltransferase
MDAAELCRALSSLIAPPLCGGCGGPCLGQEPICAGCRAAIASPGGGCAELAGVGSVTWATPYSGAARGLVSALKFQGRLRLAAVLAETLAAALLPLPDAATIVAVPAAPRRRRRRGFDPAQLIAAALAAELELPLAASLWRTDGSRQVGRPRVERLATPPRVRALGPVMGSVLVVDDVLTTGATLRACAEALRAAGATRISAGVFARALGASDLEA